MSDPPLLRVSNLQKHYFLREGYLQRDAGRVRAVDGISFTIDHGETVGLIGESGCGKSTAARAILRLTEPTGGTVRFHGDDISEFSAEELRAFRRHAAIIFQDPADSFDPKQTIGESVAEPMLIHGVSDPDRRHKVIEDLLSRCGLTSSVVHRYPHELSNGQKQRAALARALVLDPDLLVADEPVSALDMSVQAEIITLLSELQTELDLSILVISHDMGVIREVCDRSCVMYVGQIVERGPTADLLSDPKHPYTRALAEAVAIPDPDRAGDREPLPGDIPDPADPPDGCRFHPRCPSIIPPDDSELSSAVYHGILELQSQLETIGQDEGSIDGLIEAADIDENIDEKSAAMLALRKLNEIPPEVTDQDVEAVLTEALSTAVRGDPAAAASRLEDAFESVCERTDPKSRRIAEHRRAACHLYPRSESQ